MIHLKISKIRRRREGGGEVEGGGGERGGRGRSRSCQDPVSASQTAQGQSDMRNQKEELISARNISFATLVMKCSLVRRN